MHNMSLSVVALEKYSGEPEQIHRSMSLSNEEWLILSQCVEAFTASHRANHSQVVATYVTRGQLDMAVEEAAKMNSLLQQLDKLQAKLIS